MQTTSSLEFAELLREVAIQGNVLRARSLGRSMQPLLYSGDLLFIEHQDFHHLKAGNIIFFRDKNGSYVIHRLVRKSKSSENLITKGDNSRKFDDPLTSEQIIGKVIEIRRHNKKLYLDKWPVSVISYFVSQISKLNWPLRFKLVRILDRGCWVVGKEKVIE